MKTTNFSFKINLFRLDARATNVKTSRFDDEVHF